MVQGAAWSPARPAKEWLMPVTSPTYRLSDDQFARIEHLLPEDGQRGGQWKDHRLMIDGILWALADGDRFRNWTRRGLWDRILRHLQARMMRDGEIDWGLFCIDGTVVRAHQSAAGAAKKKARPASRRTTPWAAARAASARS